MDPSPHTLMGQRVSSSVLALLLSAPLRRCSAPPLTLSGLAQWLLRRLGCRHGRSKAISVFGAAQAEARLSRCDLKLPPDGGISPFCKKSDFM